MNQTSPNPLAKHFRQPAIYLKLPSAGKFWPEDSLNLPANGEIAVYPMTTRDEITLRTPDALMNGSGVVAVIQSCCPEIQNAWQMPSIDIDAVIIAIRIASYGHEMKFTNSCPHCKAVNDYAIDLRIVLESIRPGDFKSAVTSNKLSIKLCPQPYFAVNKTNQLQFEEQRLIKILEETEEQPEIRSARINQQMERIMAIGLDTMTNSTEYIEVDGEQVRNKEHIKEFYSNADSRTVKAVQDRLAKIAEETSLRPIPVNCDECTKPFEIQINFDYASFFDSGF